VKSTLPIILQSIFSKAHTLRQNKSDFQVAGKTLTDMTFLREQGLIKPLSPLSGKGKKHYRVEYDLVAFIEGRNLRYEARYPVGAKGQKTAQGSMAAAFQPGTG
jgi:hypothetical protein